jgi:cell fate (sporulation/competence/biofilm development) regulator YmcA (YheA/YmcA/DUF963 family)
MKAVIIHHLQSRSHSSQPLKTMFKKINNILNFKRLEYQIAAQNEARTIIADCAKCPKTSRRNRKKTNKNAIKNEETTKLSSNTVKY